VSADDISERYLKKAIAEINELGHEIAQAAGADRVPVLGSGHPLADIMLLKHAPQVAEVHEGVAFFGRSGQAVLKSIQRLRVDPMAIYGTNCVKFEGAGDEDAHGWLARELHVVQPKIVDESLDDQKAKRAFWEAFKALGPWWSELPPY
jgi:uracil-DNA glycosylase